MARRILLACLMLPLTIGLLYAAYCGVLIWSGNFHTVTEGQLYRSAELSKDGFARAIEAHHIRTVLNLRGPNPTSPWYQDELAATRDHGAQHYDVGISARRPVPADKLEQILSVLRTAPRPILVHCSSGADRTGFVSALYRYVIEGWSAKDAEQELSLVYGHFPYLISQSGAMDRSAEEYFAYNSATAHSR